MPLFEVLKSGFELLPVGADLGGWMLFFCCTVVWDVVDLVLSGDFTFKLDVEGGNAKTGSLLEKRTHSTAYLNRAHPSVLVQQKCSGSWWEELVAVD